MAVSKKIHMIHSMWANYSSEGFYFWTIKRKRAHSFDNEWIQLHGKANKEEFFCATPQKEAMANYMLLKSILFSQRLNLQPSYAKCRAENLTNKQAGQL